MDCEYIETESSDTALLTVAYVMAGVCGLCLLPIFVLLVQASCKRRKQQQQQQQQATSATDQPSDRTNLRNDFYNNYWAKANITVNFLQERLVLSIHAEVASSERAKKNEGRKTRTTFKCALFIDHFPEKEYMKQTLKITWFGFHSMVKSRNLVEIRN